MEMIDCWLRAATASTPCLALSVDTLIVAVVGAKPGAEASTTMSPAAAASAPHQPPIG